MSDIYKQSQRTLVWIEESTPYTDVLVGLLAEIEALGITGKTNLPSVLEYTAVEIDKLIKTTESK
jgi:hypothetical protein